MSHIFLSYSAEDRERVRPLVALLGEVATVWWDQTVRYGENWEMAVEKAVEQAACVVVAWTRESVKSSWVRSEAADARDRAILVPAMLEDVKVPLAFRHLQTAQLQEWDGNPEHPQAQALKAAVAAVVARNPLVTATVPRPAMSRQEAAREPAAPLHSRPWWARPVAILIAGAMLGSFVVGALSLSKYLLGRSFGVDHTTAGGVSNPSATPADDGGISAGVPPQTTADSGNRAAGKVAGSLVTDTATADLFGAVALQSFHYLVDRDGSVVVAGTVNAPQDGRLRIGVVHAPSWIASPYHPYTDAQIAALVALLTSLAHDNGLDLASVDFGDDPKLSELTTKMDEVRDRTAKLLELWRSSGVRPEDARVSLVSPKESLKQ